MKKKLLVLLSLILIIAMVPAEALALSADYELTDTFTQTKNVSAGEQIEGKIEGNTLTITGTTDIPLNGIGMNFVSPNSDKQGKTSGRVSGNTFTLTKNLSSLAPGLYKINIYPTSGTFTGVPALTRMIPVVIGSESGFVKYTDIEAANKAAYAVLDKLCVPSQFKKANLSDMPFVNKNPQKDEESQPLTSSQCAYIKKRTLEITKGCTTDIEKVKAIYTYAAKHLYYDNDRRGKTFNNPFYNLKRITEGTGSGYNYQNGKVAVECTGYAALEIAMARSIGIPARMVNGRHNNTYKDWSQITPLSGQNHHWAEVYVNGQWIVADATDATESDYNYNSKQWITKGISSCFTFAPTIQQLSQSHITYTVYTKPVSLKLSSGSGYILCSWSKVPASGYQLQIAANSSFTKNCKTYSVTSTSKKVTGIKSGRTYYVRIRPYVKANGIKRYSDWSKAYSIRK